MPWRTRNCRAARSISAMLPPWLLMMTSLRDAGAMHALADLDEGGERGLGRERQRAGERPVLVRRADRLHGQKQRRRVLRQQRAHARQIRLARCRYRRRPADAARAAPPPPPAAPRCGRAKILPSSGKASRSRRSVVALARACHRHCALRCSATIQPMFTGSRLPRASPIVRANFDRSSHDPSHAPRRSLLRSPLLAARAGAARSTRSRSAPTGSPRPSMAASIRRSPTAPTRNTASTSPSCRAARR